MDEANVPIVAIQIARKPDGLIGVGVSSLSRKEIIINSRDDVSSPAEATWCLEVFDFIDNEQLSNLDSVLIRFGKCVIYIAEEGDSTALARLYKCLKTLLQDKDLEDIKFIKKSVFSKKMDIDNALIKLLGGQLTQAVHVAENEHPLGYGCIGCLVFACRLLSSTSITSTGDDSLGNYELTIGSLGAYLRLDSSACDAINLFPKPDQPSKFGSIYGILNRCKTKIGSRLLMRWLRHPLVNREDINKRLDFVELFLKSPVLRSQLTDGPLRSIPDLENLVSRMTRKSANLGDAYRLYTFTKSLESLDGILNEIVIQFEYDATSTSTSAGANDDPPACSAETIEELKSRFIMPLRDINEKFAVYQQLIEHVVDFSALPEFLVDARHDENLTVIKEEMDDLVSQIDKYVSVANRTWAQGIVTDVKVEKSPVHGYILRTTKGEDERALRQHNKNVRIISILKTGCYFTTPEVESLSDGVKQLEYDYKKKQQELINQCIDTALTYLPIVDISSKIVSELDVLVSFASVAALSPAIYSRPILHPLVSMSTSTAIDSSPARVLNLKNARHPCVELMDNMSFIPNDYNLHSDTSRLQLITGPNMGGKSTYIRGIGCVIVMAQIGCFIPCDEGSEISIVDCILARVGAGDAVQKGVSTFMAEMLEASIILQTATRNSFIVIDELGRGTSTFDGYGLAWAISDYIVNQIQCLAVFATHFHELTAMSKTYKCVTNKHVTALIESNSQVVMLYQIQDGPCTQSYGIHVANMARFPPNIIREAKRKACELETNQQVPVVSSTVLVSTPEENSDVRSDVTRNAVEIQSKMQKFSELPIGDMSSYSEVVSPLKSVFLSPEV